MLALTASLAAGKADHPGGSEGLHAAKDGKEGMSNIFWPCNMDLVPTQTQLASVLATAMGEFAKNGPSGALRWKQCTHVPIFCRGLLSSAS